MARYFVAAVLCFGLVSCASVNEQLAEASDFQVISFSQGKMTEKNDKWIIYEYGEELVFRENGRCIISHRKVPCMWHGYILEYDSSGKDVKLNCSVRESKPSNFVDPHGIKKRNTRKHGYTVRLSGVDKEFINPQYTAGIFKDGTTESNVVCSIKGTEVLKFKTIMLFKRRATKT